MHIFRVKPGEELIDGIAGYCRENKISSGVIIGIIGSLEKAALNFLVRLPGKYDTLNYTGRMEIVCAQGSVALKDNDTIIHVHCHIASQAFCRGGHLASATVFSTAEVVLGELDYQLRRHADSYTGLNELLD